MPELVFMPHDGSELGIFDHALMHCQLGGDWSSDEVADFFGALAELSDLLGALNHLLIENDDRMSYMQHMKFRHPSHLAQDIHIRRRFLDDVDIWMNNYSMVLPPLKPTFLRAYVQENIPIATLNVHSIHMSSPGHTDLLGAGKIIKTLADLLMGLLKMFTERRQRAAAVERQHLENESIRLNNQAAELENLNTLVDTCRRLGFPDEEIRKNMFYGALRQDRLRRLIAGGKIRSVQVLRGTVRDDSNSSNSSKKP